MPGCPAADDPSGGACQVRTTGQGFPAHCSAQLAAAHKNILFLGNSYTTTNNLPGVLASLAAAAGGAGMVGRRHYLTWRECRPQLQHERGGGGRPRPRGPRGQRGHAGEAAGRGLGRRGAAGPEPAAQLGSPLRECRVWVVRASNEG